MIIIVYIYITHIDILKYNVFNKNLLNLPYYLKLNVFNT